MRHPAPEDADHDEDVRDTDSIIHSAVVLNATLAGAQSRRKSATEGGGDCEMKSLSPCSV